MHRILKFMAIFLIVQASSYSKAAAQLPLTRQQAVTVQQLDAQAMARRHERFGKVRSLLIDGQVPYDPDILITRDWRSQLASTFEQMPQMQVSKVLQGALQGVVQADTLVLPETTELAGDTVIIAQHLQFDGPNPIVRGPHNLYVFLIGSMEVTQDQGQSRASTVAIDTRGRGRTEWLQKNGFAAKLDSVRDSGPAVEPESILQQQFDTHGGPGFDGDPGSVGNDGTDGSAGDNGQPGSCGISANGENGANGGHGQAGTNGGTGGNGGTGEDGGDIYADIYYYTGTLYCYAWGGDGGNGGWGGGGGKGGNGGNGGNAASGGNGGKGGDGGDGGSGGNIELNIWYPLDPWDIWAENYGGNGGMGGQGAIAGEPGTQGTGGHGGSPGGNTNCSTSQGVPGQDASDGSEAGSAANGEAGNIGWDGMDGQYSVYIWISPSPSPTPLAKPDTTSRLMRNPLLPVIQLAMDIFPHQSALKKD